MLNKSRNIFLILICCISLLGTFIGFAILSETLTITGQVVAYKSYKGVTLDGKLNDSIWTTDVKNSPIDLNSETGNNFVDIYATRTDQDLFFLAEYYTKVVKEDPNGNWWLSDNIELRIIDQSNHYVKNKLCTNDYQFYISGKGVHGISTVTDFYVSEPVFNANIGLYEIKFEWAIAYSDMTRWNSSSGAFDTGLAINASTPLGFYAFGNPCDSNVFATWNMGAHSNDSQKVNAFAYSYKINKYGIDKSGAPMASLDFSKPYNNNDEVGNGHEYLYGCAGTTDHLVKHSSVKSSLASDGSYSNSGFSLPIKVFMNGNNSWDLECKFKTTGLSTANNWDTFVGEIGSADENGQNSRGVFTFRADWWGWSYPVLENGYQSGTETKIPFYDVTNFGDVNDFMDDVIPVNCFSSKEDGSDSEKEKRVCAHVWSKNFKTLKQDLTVRMRVTYNAATRKITVKMKYHASDNHSAAYTHAETGYSFQDAYLTYTVSNVMRNGRMYFSLGVSNAKIVLQYIKRFNGVMYTSTDDFEDLSGQMEEVPNYNGTNDVYSNAGYSLSLLKNQTFTSGTYKVDITGVGGNYKFLGGDSIKNASGGIVFNYSKENNSTYRFYYNTPYRQVIVDEVKNGVVKTLYSNYLTAEYNEKNPYTFKVVMKNGVAYCYMNNNLIYHFTPSLPGNRVGILAGSVFTKFSNYSVTSDTTIIDDIDTLIIGHSYMERWTSYKNDLSGLGFGNILNIGLGGTVAKHWEAYKDEIPVYGADRVIYMIGINDLNNGQATPDSAVADITQLLLHLKEKNPNLEVILCTVNYTPNTHHIDNLITEMNGLIRELCSNYSWVKCADLDNYIGTATNLNGSYFAKGDELHLSADGYGKLVEAINARYTPSFSSSSLAAAKEIKKCELYDYSERAYTSENWKTAQTYYNNAIIAINACTTTVQVEALDLTTYINQLKSVERITDTMANEMYDDDCCISWESDNFAYELESGYGVNPTSVYGVMGDGHRLNTKRVFTDMSFTYKLTDNSYALGSTGVLVRAEQTDSRGLNGYLINFKTNENYIQIYYMYESFGIDDETSSVTKLIYIDGWVYPLDVENKEFRIILEGNYLYIYENDDFLYGGRDAYARKVNLSFTNGGVTYPVYEKGFYGYISWDGVVAGKSKLSIDNITGEYDINYASEINNKMGDGVNTVTLNANNITFVKNEFNSQTIIDKYNFTGSGYKLYKGVTVDDFSMEFTLRNTNAVAQTIGYLVRATQTADGGINGYLVNYSYNNDGYLLQVFYLSNFMNTKGTTAQQKYIGGLVCGKNDTDTYIGEKVTFKMADDSAYFAIGNKSNAFKLTDFVGNNVYRSGYVGVVANQGSFSATLYLHSLVNGINSCDEIGHDYEITRVEPTCTTNGSITYVCVDCDYTYVETLKALGHSYTNYVKAHTASCTGKTTETAQCDNGCGTSNTRSANATLNYTAHIGTYTNNKWTCCNSIISTTITHNVNAFNVTALQFDISGSDWEVQYEFLNQRTSNSTAQNHSWAMDIYSIPAWGSGGVSFTSDGNNWQQWPVVWSTSPASMWTNYIEATRNMNVTMNVKYSSSTKVITITVNCRPTNSAYAAKTFTMTITNNSHTGTTFGLAFGTYCASVTLYSVKVIKGTIVWQSKH